MEEERALRDSASLKRERLAKEQLSKKLFLVSSRIETE